MNPFTLVNGEPYPLDMRGELDDTAAFKNFKKYTYLDVCFSIRAWLTSELCTLNAIRRVCCLMDVLLYVQVGWHWVSAAFWKSPEPNRKFHSLVGWKGSCLCVIMFMFKFIKSLHPKTEFNHGNWNFPFNSIGEMNKSYSCVDTADKCIFEIHGVEPQRTHLDNGSWRWCKCYICWHCKSSAYHTK